MSKAVLKWPALLLCQYLLLAWGAGIFASRFLLPGLCGLLIVCLAVWRQRGKYNVFHLLLFLLLSFGLGFAYAAWRTPEKPIFSAWLEAAIAPDAEGKRSDAYKNGLLVRARVDEVNGQTDRRLQLILSQIRAVDFPYENLPGRLALTWHLPATPEAPKPLAPGIPVFRAASRPNSGHAQGLPSTASDTEGKANLPDSGHAPLADEDSIAPLTQRPLPGQEIELMLRIRPVRGLKNPGLWDIEPYWADQNVWLRASITGTNAFVRLYDEKLDSIQLLAGAGRESLRQRVLNALPRSKFYDDVPEIQLAPGTDFIPALLFGDRFLLDSADTELFARSTLMHSLALSGLHLGYAAALGYALALLLYHCFPGLGLYLPRRKLAVCLALVPALIYLWLGGAPPSLLRSALMLFFCALLLFLRRPVVLLDSLFWAVAIILLVDPLALFDLRLQLSAMAIAAIALSAPWLAVINQKMCKRLANQQTGLLRSLLSSATSACLFTLGTSFAIQLALMPLLVKSFGIYGLAFPLNLLWLPVLGLVVMPLAFCGLAAAALHISSLAELCFHLAALPCAWLMEGLRWLEPAGLLPVSLPVRPHWTFMLGFWLLLALLPQIAASYSGRNINFAWRNIRFAWHNTKNLLPGLIRKPVQPPATNAVNSMNANAAVPGLPKNTAPRFPLLLFCLGLGLCLFPQGLRQYEITRDVVRLRLLDVGQGQAVLLEWPGGGRLLLDGGGSMSPRFNLGKEVVAATLISNRAPQLDYMLASHPDMDHIQGLLFPLKYLKIDHYADNGETHTRLRELLLQKALSAPAAHTSSLNTPDLPTSRLEATNSLPLYGLHAGQTIHLTKDLRLEILHPPAGPLTSAAGAEITDAEPSAAAKAVREVEVEQNQQAEFTGNNASLVARLVWREEPLALLCGDVEKKAQRFILKNISEQSLQPIQKAQDAYTQENPYSALQAQVLVLPHHGAAGAFLPQFQAAVNPSLALASCGYANRWGFPSKVARESLKASNVPLLSTGESGQIIVEWQDGGKSMRVFETRRFTVRQ